MLILDTHAFLWTLDGSDKLSAKARERIVAQPEELTLSHASIWEMAIKVQLGKLRLRKEFDPFVREHIEERAVTLLGIELSHIKTYRKLPLHHRDPFDRILAAQAIEEKAALISHDTVFDGYGVERIW